jgi:hypothetical protein
MRVCFTVFFTKEGIPKAGSSRMEKNQLLPPQPGCMEVR